MTSEITPVKTYSWPLIIFLLFIFWPVGVYFLIRKVNGDKKATLSSGRTMTIWGWIIAGMGIISWTTLIEDGFIDGTLGMLFFVAMGLTLVYFGKKASINAAKYKKYIDLIVNNNVRSIPTISSAIPVSHDVAVKDLENMIAKGFFEDAYMNYTRNEIVFAVEDERVRNTKVEMIVVPCHGCGANNQVEKGQVEKCQYCGSLISG